jgi:hypothetical protein
MSTAVHEPPPTVNLSATVLIDPHDIVPVVEMSMVLAAVPFSCVTFPVCPSTKFAVEVPPPIVSVDPPPSMPALKFALLIGLANKMSVHVSPITSVAKAFFESIKSAFKDTVALTEPVVDTLAAVSSCTSVDPHVNVPDAMSIVDEASPFKVRVRPAAPTMMLPVELAPSAMRTMVPEDNPVARFNVPFAVAPE